MALSDQVIVITGCSTGIGHALAAELASRNHYVFATARRPERLTDLTGRVERLALDVTDESSIQAAIGTVIERVGRVDILVNNAGFNLIGPLAEVPMSGFRKLFETNVTGLLAVTQAVFPHMANRRSGRIVNFGSVVGLFGTPFAGAYCATKSAVHMMTDVLRMEVAPLGIDVILVQPGGVRSSIADTASQGLERYARAESKYQRVHEHIVRRAGASQESPMPTEEFATRVADAILTDKPPRMLRAGRGAHVLPRLAKLPGPALDRVLQRQFGLTKLG